MRDLQCKNELRRRKSNGDDEESTHCVTSQRSSDPDVWPTLMNWDSEETGYKRDPFAEQDDRRRPSRVTRCKYTCRGLAFELKHFFIAFSSKPYIWLTCLLVFSSACTLGLWTLHCFCIHYRHDLEHTLLWYAMEIESTFEDLLRSTLIPLYSVQQAIIFSETFHSLPYKIGNYGDEGAAPVVSDPLNKGIYNYRNVTGICDDLHLLEELKKAVDIANSNAKMDGIIVNYRLVPNNVICMAEPLINYRDFPEGEFLNSTNDIGKDVFHTPGHFWHDATRHIYNNGDPQIIGPFNFSDMGFDVMDEGYCEHLAVNLPGYNISIDGVIHSSWGFVQSFINWSRMKEKSGINEKMREEQVEFHLTKHEMIFNAESRNYQEKVTTVARSDNYNILNEFNSVIRRSHTINDEWVLRIGFQHGFMLPYHRLWNTIIVIQCFIFTIMIAIILVEKMQHRTLLHQIMPRRAVKKLQTGRVVVDRYKIVTIFFSDIVGFTKMASEMGPLNVMKMLNDLYSGFDKLVDKHGLYKVETIGDSYMVVGGAPTYCPAPEAAEKVALFALDVIDLVKTFIAPHGKKIQIRCGIASGPVVAGVVGESMPRYCFFGDTVNMASRMESTSESMEIQCTDLTCRILNDSPKILFSTEKRFEHGLNEIHVKGKGLIHTWWIKGKCDRQEVGTEIYDIEIGETKGDRNVEVTTIYEGLRTESFTSPKHDDQTSQQYLSLSKQSWSIIGQNTNGLVAATSDKKVMVNRCAAILDARLNALLSARRGYDVIMDPRVRNEIYSYVSQIESMYNDVEYHSFQHASHVMISMNSFISELQQMEIKDRGKYGAQLSDPFIIFTLLLSALVHDVCHTGKSNNILKDEQDRISRLYPNHYAERLSIDRAVDVLLEKKYITFREAFIPDAKRRLIFVRLLFCSIISTDIAEPETVEDGKSRFYFIKAVNEAFGDDNERADQEVEYDRNLCPLRDVIFEICLKVASKVDIEEHMRHICLTKANLELCVLSEHLMQSCDVAHLMQDFANYVKWNFRLYKEVLVCHKAGLAPDPKNGWIKGQAAFVESYVLPLAKRTEFCLGKCANLESLANKNNDRWKREGEMILDIYAQGIERNETEDQILQKCLS